MDVTDSTIPLCQSSTVCLHSDDSSTDPMYHHPSTVSLRNCSTDNNGDSLAIDVCHSPTIPSSPTPAMVLVMEIDNLCNHQKEIYSLFMLLHTKEAQYIHVGPSNPTPPS